MGVGVWDMRSLEGSGGMPSRKLLKITCRCFETDSSGFLAASRLHVLLWCGFKHLLILYLLLWLTLCAIPINVTSCMTSTVKVPIICTCISILFNSIAHHYYNLFSIVHVHVYHLFLIMIVVVLSFE